MSFKNIEQRSAWPINTSLMKHVEEQMAANEELEAVPAPPAGSIPIEKIRQFRQYNADGSPKPILVEQAVDAVLNTTSGNLPIRSFEVANWRGIYLHFHGGGWVMGAANEQDQLLWDLAQKTQMKVVSVDYPLAPETQLDLIIESVVAATHALMDQNTDQLFCIGGESAGSHLAMSAVLGIADDQEKIDRIAALNLCYGIYDISMTPSQRQWGDRMLGLSSSYLEWFYDLALPDTSEQQRASAAVSPLYHEQLTGLPPAIFTIGEYDPLLDDSLFMAAKWKAAGNVTKLKVYPKAPHGFNALETGMSRAANKAIIKFLNTRYAKASANSA